MEERTFSWFPKLTKVMASLPPEHVAEFAIAVANYGTNGVEPSFENPLMAAVFEGVRGDIDNSLTNKYRNKGGRPPKNPRENGGSEVSETSETPVSENENPTKPVSKTGNPSYISKAKQSNAIKKEPSDEGSKKPPRHRHGLYGNVLLSDDDLAKLKAEFPDDWQERIERLSEHIASKGTAYKNHLATIRSWARRDRQEAEKKGGGDHDPVYSAL